MHLSRLIAICCLYLVSLSAHAVVEDSQAPGMGQGLAKLQEQCASVSEADRVACYELGIDLLLGLTSEDITVTDETPPVIQNMDVFTGEDSPRFKFAGNINGFEFQYQFKSITDLRYSCFANDIGVPEELSSFDIRFYIDNQPVETNINSLEVDSKYELCSIFVDNASKQTEIPINHLPGIVVTGTHYNRGFHLPFLIQFENLNQFYRECVAQYNGDRYYQTNSFHLAIHTNVQSSEWTQYWSTNRGNWVTVESLCSAIKSTVKKLIPSTEWN